MKHTCLPICLLSVLIFSACSMPRPGMIRDLETLPQDAGAYHGLDPDAPLLSPGAQAALYAQFLRRHFAPWTADFQTTPRDTAYWALARYTGKETYGQNTLKRDPNWLPTVAEEARKNSYPSMSRPCIAVTNTSLRSLPTHEPLFWSFDRPGEGFPFDYMQNSLVLAGTPLRAGHLSKSGKWVFVESRFAFGWVPIRDIAWTDKAFMNAFNAPGMIAFTRDYAPVRDTQGRFRFTAHIGTVLPLAQRPGDGGYKTLIPVRDAQGNAVVMEAAIPREQAALMPLPATPRTFAGLANAMLGRPYGWGGLYEDRDCSATLMDLMTPFGIYLPRNSSQQYKQGSVTELNGLGRANKKRVLLEHGIPFLTLVRSPGHIMLYIGQRDGEPVVFQTMWGLKTQFLFGDTGRHIIGRTVITTLEPGKELYNLSPARGNLLDSVYGLTFLITNKQASSLRQSGLRDK